MELRGRCQCDFEANLISSAGFRCFPQTPIAVTFRAVLTGFPQATAPELAILLEAWTSSGAFLAIQAQVLSIDGSCAVAISSFGESECNPEEIIVSATSDTAEEILVSDTSDTSEAVSSEPVPPSADLTVIASVVTVAVFLVLVLILILGFILIRRRNKLQTP